MNTYQKLTEQEMEEIADKNMTPDEVFEKYGIVWEEYEMLQKDFQEM